ncbi:epoxyqueuosine reductase [Clostridium sp. DJ247]|uniref:epoxyqueuosine reductase n=1 Tax=Clostridium sp. DJ247 TaxID=2726188 RepID=UPI001625CFE2|nr:epoxyqueuosine reductase [Clostridium sp. DJ247]MBC2579064.1 epoxyqueuosine reductase [Clostridium sp. DJ247]
MKEKITKMIRNFVKEYEQKNDISTKWGEPLVGFADANHPYILNLKKLITPTHKLPTDVLSDASIVIAYFIPFTKELANTNRMAGAIASPEWALAYEETNAMFVKLNEYIILELRKIGYHADVSSEASTFDQKILKSNWSHRHFAKVAGLGTFGINNMLITKMGCCGRYSTIVTNLDVNADSPLEDELCLYKKNRSCGICVKHCPSGALTLDGYDRHKCYAVLRKNAELYTEFGSSYTNESGDHPNSVGSEVCGKCVVNTPCTFFYINTLICYDIR